MLRLLYYITYLYLPKETFDSRMKRLYMSFVAALFVVARAGASVPDVVADSVAGSAVMATDVAAVDVAVCSVDSLAVPEVAPVAFGAEAWSVDSVVYDGPALKNGRMSIYEMPYSLTGRVPHWHNLWVNTAVLGGAYVSALLVLQCLPEDATSWNRAAITSVPLFKRWWRNNFKLGPEIDGDNAIFNYVLHPYAGAVYFMSARSQGFNFYQSFLYSAAVSTIGWEYGIEAFMERPSIQDLLITPIVGSVVGELFYRVKRSIVSRDYTLAGSRVLGNVVVFLVDPINEVIGLFRGNDARELARDGMVSSLVPTFENGRAMLTLSCCF